MTKEEIRDAKIKTEMEILERIHEIKRIYDQFLSFAQIDDEFGYLSVCIIKDKVSFNNTNWRLPKEIGIDIFSSYDSTVYYDLSSDSDAYEFFAGDSKC